MKPNQEFTPKYWVLHNKETDDVLISTASKSFDGCKQNARCNEPTAYEKYYHDDERYEIVLISVDFASAGFKSDG
jgi:hypothetical protein